MAFVLGKIGIGCSTGGKFGCCLVGWLVGWSVFIGGRSFAGCLVFFLESGLFFLVFFFSWYGSGGLRRRLICFAGLGNEEPECGQEGRWERK